MDEFCKEKIEFVKNRILNSVGFTRLRDKLIFKNLVLAFTRDDIILLGERCIYFLPMFSPASQSQLKFCLPKYAHIICIDINALDLFSREEATAIILHEIGHTISPEINNEYDADDYALRHDYGEYLISALEKGKEIDPKNFDKEITYKRIQRIKDKLSGKA